MMEWLTLKWSATLLWLKPSLCMPTAWHLSGTTGLMKVVFCYALPMVVQGFDANETLHFSTTTFWGQLLLGVGM
jgi:hypothetical protein